MPPAPKKKAAKASEPTPEKAAPETEETPQADVVKQASAAERKAAMEAMLEEEGMIPFMRPAPKRDRDAVTKEVPPEQRKAVVENLMKKELAPTLARAPWKRRRSEPEEKAGTAGESTTPEGERPQRLRMTRPEGKAQAQQGTQPATPAPITTTTPPRYVIVDTNALMMQFQFHIDIEKELRRILDFKYEIVVPDVVINELDILAKEARGKDATEARMALELAKTFKPLSAPTEGDTGILRLAEKVNGIVVTNDKVLRARLRAKNIPNVYMRNSAFLTVEGHITGI